MIVLHGKFNIVYLESRCRHSRIYINQQSFAGELFFLEGKINEASLGGKKGKAEMGRQLNEFFAGYYSYFLVPLLDVGLVVGHGKS